ncbi:MAG: metallophosphoesterase [Oscillospiraceae bacterium]
MGYTYVVSDIHGQMMCFEAILRKINLQPDDRLYILGDVIDRGVHGIEILQHIMAMPNAQMLLGNHEYMMLNALGEPYDGISRDIQDCVELWYTNGGRKTHSAYRRQPKRIKDNIKSYLKSLPLNLDIEVMQKKYRLVHAADMDFYDSSDCCYTSLAEFSVWDRNALDKMRLSDRNYVYGHTMTFLMTLKYPMEIVFDGNLIAIDCGCAAISAKSGRRRFGDLGGRLGCIRLDDMKCFYSDEYKAPDAYSLTKRANSSKKQRRSINKPNSTKYNRKKRIRK